MKVKVRVKVIEYRDVEVEVENLKEVSQKIRDKYGDNRLEDSDLYSDTLEIVKQIY